MTSVTITSVSFNADAGTLAGAVGGGNHANNANNANHTNHADHGNHANHSARAPADDMRDIGGQRNKQGGNASLNAVLDAMNIPEGIKDLLRKVLSDSSSANLPSEASAVDTMQKFQNANKDKLREISFDEMKDIASGKRDSIHGVKIPDDVKEAAKTYVANHGALFDKVESATNGKHDSKLGSGDPDHLNSSQLSKQPTTAGTGPDSFMRACANNHISPNEPDEYGAVKAMGKFQKDNDIKLISYDQLKDIASGKTTEINGKAIPDEVKDAAKAYVANNGALFDKVEAATDGKHDSKLGAGDPEQALKKGIVNVSPMSEKTAVGVMEEFQKNGGPKHINIDQMNDIASGKISSMGMKEVTPEVKAAAQAFVANHGALFDKMEAATDGKHDSRLGSGDADQARKKGIVLSDQAPSANQAPNAHQGPNAGQNAQRQPDDALAMLLGSRSKREPQNDDTLQMLLGGQQQGERSGPSVDGRPSAGGNANPAGEVKAVETMEKFQNNGGPKHINFDEMKDIASGKIKELGGKDIMPEVKAAAQTYVANHGALFDKMEAATDGKHDSKLGSGDPQQARNRDMVGSSDNKAADPFSSLQQLLSPGSAMSDEEREAAVENGDADWHAVLK